MFERRTGGCVIGLWLLAMALYYGVCTAEEYSVLATSTVIGQNFGYPSGTPSQGHPGRGQIDFVTEMTVFTKNLELASLDVEGETLFGVLAPLRFRYHAGDKVSFELGAVLGHNFGDDNNLDIAEPVIRLVAEPFEDVYVVAGTIFPTHWIHDALHDDVQKYRTNAEQGLQFRINRTRFRHETWINWRVREGAIRPEEFEIGSASQARLFGDVLRVDAQAMMNHIGGQISTSPRVETNISLLGGASIGARHLFGRPLFDEFRVGLAYLFSDDDEKFSLPVRGNGWEASTNLNLAVIRNSIVRLHASYFNGEDLLARRGDPLYRYNHYIQGGVTGLFGIGPDLGAEVGVVWQRTQGITNYTFQINFSWANAFDMNFLKPRARQVGAAPKRLSLSDENDRLRTELATARAEIQRLKTRPAMAD